MDVRLLCVVEREIMAVCSPLPVSAMTARELLRMKWRETVAADYDYTFEEDDDPDLSPPSFWLAQTMALAAR